MNYYLSIDQGTTGTTIALIDATSFNLIAKSNSEFRQILPAPGLVEHDLNDIWATVKSCTTNLLKENCIDPKEIKAIGITNQRETTCAFNKSGTPLTNAIVWQDRRTNDFCEKLKNEGKESFIKEKTGLPIDPYFSATKINWMLRNDKSVLESYKNNDLLVGTIDTYLLYLLSGNKEFKTEVTNASRTMLMDLKTCQWDNELLKTFEIPQEILPKICCSFGTFAKTFGLDFLPDGIPITGILGDQQSALFGQGGIEKGDLKCTYGTGAFAVVNTGTEIKYSKNGLLTTVAYQDENETIYAIEGSSYIAGAAVQWLRDNISIISSASETEQMARDISNLEEMKHVCFYPYFTGIGSPHWNAEAKASITGISRDTNKSHITRACLEGIALTIDELLVAMSADLGEEIKQLCVDGGAVQNDFLLEIQASFSNLTVIRPTVIETTAFGAALAAAVGNNDYKIKDVKQLWSAEKTFPPRVEVEYHQSKKKTWMDDQKKIYL